VEPLTRGLPPPDPCSLCPLSSTEFVEPYPLKKIPGYATAAAYKQTMLPSQIVMQWVLEALYLVKSGQSCTSTSDTVTQFHYAHAVFLTFTFLPLPHTVSDQAKYV
jgi:hypothetical protein